MRWSRFRLILFTAHKNMLSLAIVIFPYPYDCADFGPTDKTNCGDTAAAATPSYRYHKLIFVIAN